MEDVLRGFVSWTLGQFLTDLERTVLTGLVTVGNVYALILFVSKLVSCVVHLCGCCGSGSTQSWSQALCWALCPACALALKARKGFHPPDPQPSSSHHLPQSPAPSAPPVPEMKVGADRAGQEREEREGADSSSRFLSWRTRNKKKSLAPPPPAKKPAREPEEAIPLIVFSRTAPRVATTKAIRPLLPIILLPVARPDPLLRVPGVPRVPQSGPPIGRSWRESWLTRRQET